MRIKKLNLSCFGRFKNFHLELDHPFTVIVGKNEAGKTTMINAIAAILFGFTGPRRDLHRRYAPWGDEKNFRASLFLQTEDGTEYLVGRDFANGRTELFRCEGIRLEPLDEKRLQELIQSEIGIANPNLFEHTFLIRENEVDLLEQDSRSRGGLSEFLGRRLVGGENPATIGEACRLLEEQLQKLSEGGEMFPGGIKELRAQIESLSEELRRNQELFFRGLRIERELESVAEKIKALNAQIESLKGRLANEGTENNPEALLEEVRRRIARLTQERDRLVKMREEAVQREKTEKQPVLSDESFRQCEEILNRLSAIEVEERCRWEQIRDSRNNNAILEKEAQSLREKLKALGEWHSNPDLQAQVSGLLQKINKGQHNLLELSKRVSSGESRVRRGARLTVILGGLSLIGGSGSAAAWFFRLLPRTAVYGIAGLAGVLLVGAVVALFSLGHLRRAAAREKDEYLLQETETHLLQEELAGLLRGKTIEEYRRENELYRLYRNDLWHLENMLEQQKRIEGGDELRTLREEAEDLRRQMRLLLAPLGDLPQDAWREALENERRVRILAEERAENAPPENWREVDLTALEEELSRLRLEEEKWSAVLAERSSRPDAAEQLAGLEEELHRLEAEKARLEAEKDLLRQSSPKDTWETANLIAEKELLLAHLTMEEEATRLALSLLKTAADDSAGQIGPELERLAGEYLSVMTGGRYARVTLEISGGDLAVKVSAPETGEWLSPNMLSAGVLDQVYLAFRFALAEVIAKAHHYPLFLDDPFHHFDRERLKGAVALLKQLSKDHQVIWWTKDLDLVRELTEVNTIVLE